MIARLIRQFKLGYVSWYSLLMAVVLIAVFRHWWLGYFLCGLVGLVLLCLVFAVIFMFGCLAWEVGNKLQEWLEGIFKAEAKDG